MHEVSIADALLRQVTETASRHGLRSVQGVGVCVGDLSGIVPDSLAFAFEILRRGSIADEASLQIRASAGDDLRLEWIEGE